MSRTQSSVTPPNTSTDCSAWKRTKRFSFSSEEKDDAAHEAEQIAQRRRQIRVQAGRRLLGVLLRHQDVDGSNSARDSLCSSTQNA